MSRDPRHDPQAGDRITNGARTVIARKGDKVIFGIDEGGVENCGAHVCDLVDWQEWARGGLEVIPARK